MEMKRPLIIGAATAVTIAVAIYFRRILGPVQMVKDIAQLLVPFFLAFAYALKPGNAKEKLWNIGFALGSFFIVLSVLSPFAYKYWVIYYTPAGYPYSRYGLDALYPFLGIFIVLIAFIFGLVVVLAQDVLHKSMNRGNSTNTSKR